MIVVCGVKLEGQEQSEDVQLKRSRGYNREVKKVKEVITCHSVYVKVSVQVFS